MMGQFSEKAKPDFPDLDNDGDKKEPMSQAIAQRDGEDDDVDLIIYVDDGEEQ